MHVLVTAGPTREPLDSVRFLTNASSGRMGYAVAAAAAEAGHEVTLLTGPVALEAPPGCRVEPFATVEDLRAALERHFPACDVLVMAAAVGDFRPERRAAGKIPRAGGPVTLRLVPTADVLAAVAAGRRAGQRIVAFAVEDAPREEAERKARAELARKGADLVVVNTPAAMAAESSEACILDAGGRVLPWARRSKDELARRLLAQLEARAAGEERPR